MDYGKLEKLLKEICEKKSIDQHDLRKEWIKKYISENVDLCEDKYYIKYGTEKDSVLIFGDDGKFYELSDGSRIQKEVFDKMFKISNNQVIFGGNYFDLPPTRGIICWDKNIGTPHNFSHWEMAWTSFDCPAKKFVKTNDTNKQHPTQKPVELMRWILEKYSKEGDLICDPFMGSWTTARACKDLNRDFIGFELSEEYCKVGEKRLEQEILF